jgi:hypothetical protein
MDERTRNIRTNLKIAAAGFYLMACFICTAGDFRGACVLYMIAFILMPVSSDSWW